jgi:hypothetical protein
VLYPFSGEDVVELASASLGLPMSVIYEDAWPEAQIIPVDEREWRVR